MPRKAESKRHPAKQNKPKPKKAERPPSREDVPHDDFDVHALVEDLNEASNEPPEDEEEPVLIPTREWSHGYVLDDDDSGEAFLDRRIKEWRERDERFAAGKATPQDEEKQRQEDNLRAFTEATIEKEKKKRERGAARRREIENEERASYGLPPLEDVKPGATAAAVVTQADKPGLAGDTHGPDFRSVRWGGETYEFTANQAACVGRLWEAMENGTPDVGGATLLTLADINSNRIQDVFRDNPAWGVLIVPGATKGAYRIAEKIS